VEDLQHCFNFSQIEVTRPDGSAVPNTLVSVSSTTYPGSQELSKAYTSDENGYVIFQQTIGEDVTSLNINVGLYYEQLKLLTYTSLQMSAGHRILSGQILHFANLGWSNLRSQKIVYLTHFLLMKPTSKHYRQHFSTIRFNFKSTSPSIRI
jgi:hypothetical protein